MDERIQAILNKLSDILTTATNKQDRLVGSGTGQNIKTIKGQNVLGSGDIQFDEFSGDYNDLTNKPEIPEVDAMSEEDIDDAIDEGGTLAELIRGQVEEETISPSVNNIYSILFANGGNENV